MNLTEIKNVLPSMSEVIFQLPDGNLVPKHVHITEVGLITKNFIDCGGTVRQEKRVSFQLWEANDYDHRLGAEKLLKIIALSEKAIAMEDAEVEVEYQGNTIGKYGLAFTGKHFLLYNLKTACLASDSCGIKPEKQKLAMADLGKSTSCCSTESNCC